MRVLVRTVPVVLLGTALAACGSAAPGSTVSATSARPLDVLREPSGATAWKANGAAPLGLGPFVRDFYTKSAWRSEETLYAQRKFVSGTVQGWINPDGSQQSISIACFSDARGARQTYADLVAALTQNLTPTEAKVTDPVDGATGAADTQPDSLGNTKVDLAAQVGDYLIDVHEYTPGKPDADAAAALLRQQVAVVRKIR